MSEQPTSFFRKPNYLILLTGISILTAGFVTMTLDTEPYGFGWLGLTLGPILVMVGLLIPFYSIFTGSGAKPTRASTSFEKWNRGVGWFIFILTLGVYFRTLEPTTSFWDCGEFIAAAYKLQVPHAPGAPLFLLIGHLFSSSSGLKLDRIGIIR